MKNKDDMMRCCLCGNQLFDDHWIRLGEWDYHIDCIDNLRLEREPPKKRTVAPPEAPKPPGTGVALTKFLLRLTGRLAKGEKEYGDKSFARPLSELIDEVQQELEDVSGWSYVGWKQMEDLRKRADGMLWFEPKAEWVENKCFCSINCPALRYVADENRCPFGLDDDLEPGPECPASKQEQKK